MKILLVIPFFELNYGGPVISAYGLSKKLAEKKHEIFICTTDIKKNDGHIKDSEKITSANKNMKILYFKCSNSWIGNKLRLVFSSQMRMYIKNNIKYFDIVHIHEIRGIHAIYVWYYARKYNIRYIIQAHGAAPLHYPNENIFLFIFKSISHFMIDKKIFKKASKAIALTELEKKQFEKLGIPKHKIEIIGNGIDLDDTTIPHKGKFRKKYSIKSEDKIILYLGQIHPIKNLELLIDAFNELSVENDNIKLVLVGPDSGNLAKLKEKTIEMKIEDKILFTGPIYGIKKLEAYVDADIYVLPSLYETFPNTVLEAAFCGTPVIITENCGLSSTFKENELGIVIKSNVNELKEAILELLNDEKSSAIYSKNAKKWVSKNYNWETITLKFENLYDQILC